MESATPATAGKNYCMDLATVFFFLPRSRMGLLTCINGAYKCIIKPVKADEMNYLRVHTSNIHQTA